MTTFDYKNIPYEKIMSSPEILPNEYFDVRQETSPKAAYKHMFGFAMLIYAVSFIILIVLVVTGMQHTTTETKITAKGTIVLSNSRHASLHIQPNSCVITIVTNRHIRWQVHLLHVVEVHSGSYFSEREHEQQHPSDKIRSSTDQPTRLSVPQDVEEAGPLQQIWILSAFFQLSGKRKR